MVLIHFHDRRQVRKAWPLTRQEAERACNRSILRRQFCHATCGAAWPCIDGVTPATNWWAQQSFQPASGQMRTVPLVYPCAAPAVFAILFSKPCNPTPPVTPSLDVGAC